MSVPDAGQLAESIEEAAQTITQTQPSLFTTTGRLVALSGREVVVVGDIHGDYSSLQYILTKTWFRERAEDGEPMVLVCMGDYIDRGPGQVEVLYTLTRLLVEYPRNVVLLRGNHEGRSDVTVLGLAYEEVEDAEFEAFLESSPVSYPILKVDVYEPPQPFGTPKVLPTTIILDPQGRAVKAFLGPVTRDDIEGFIDGV